MTQHNNERMGTPLFYKWVAGVFSVLIVAGVIGIFNMNIKLAVIEEQIKGLQGQFNGFMADRFTGSEGRAALARVANNTDAINEVKTKLQDHIVWDVSRGKGGQ